MKITIEEMLVERDIISRQQLERVKEIQKSHEDKSLTDMLLLLGYTTEDVIMNCFSDRDDMEIIHLEERTADPAAIEMLPESFIVNNEIVPVCFEKGDLLVACAFPVDPDILEEAATISGMTIRPVLTPADQIQKMLSGMETITEEKKKAAETGKTAEKVESAPAVRLVNTLIESAYKRNASDIHIEPGKEFLTIRFRIDGDLCMYTKMEMSYHRPVVTRLKLMGEMDIAEKRLPQDGKYRYEKEEMATDLRISTLPSVYGEKVVLRLLGNDRDSSLMDVRRLGMDEKQEEIFGRMLKAPFGIILVTGPTGSGKSTTLYAALSQLAEKKINCVTVEDPVEKLINGVTQVQVNAKAGLTFAMALRSILRQDPDVIMVGEIRDEETADIGVRAAVTGHLVLSTLHTNDCVSAVYRLQNMGIPCPLSEEESAANSYEKKQDTAGAEQGVLVPVGGGKDSAVTLELLKGADVPVFAYIINPRGATIHTTESAKLTADHVISVHRTLDKRMLQLNKEGFLNGHTPFSALVAFSSVIAARMAGLSYIALSNESSANESTVQGSTVNHQYSKSFKFEEDFHQYQTDHLPGSAYYFSMLRPLSEFQIAKYFAKQKQYHKIFRSCNAGSKTDSWCGHCPKCLFVYLILSPFLSREEVKEIFGTDMLNDPDMQPTLEQLVGIQEEKPFECVGSRDEINTAIVMTIDNLERSGKELPYLLKYYKTTGLYEAYKAKGDQFSSYFDKQNLVPTPWEKLVEKNCKDEA